MAVRRPSQTSEHEDPVRVYLDAIGRHPLLTKDDEVRLSKEIEVGREARATLESTGTSLPRSERRLLERSVTRGERAWDTFVESNLRLVVSIAKRYQASGLPLLDLVQEGNLGLMHAVDKFDWRKGFKFSTYATWWIRQSIQRGIANTARVIRLPAQAEDELTRLRRAWALLEDRGVFPSQEALAEEADLTTKRAAELLPYISDPASLQATVDEAGETELGDLIADATAEAPSDAALQHELESEVDRMLAVLDERERKVIRLRYGLDHGTPRSPEEVGALVDLSRERVRQIEAKALARLRHPAMQFDVAELLAG